MLKFCCAYIPLLARRLLCFNPCVYWEQGGSAVVDANRKRNLNKSHSDPFSSAEPILCFDTAIGGVCGLHRFARPCVALARAHV